MTALALVPSVVPVNSPRRAYSASQLKTMATAIYNRLQVIYHEFGSVAQSHNKTIEKHISRITEDSTVKQLTCIIKHGKPAQYDGEHRYHYSRWFGDNALEITEHACRALLFVNVTSKKHIDYCAKLKRDTTDIVDRLRAMQIKYNVPYDDAVLDAVTDEAVFGTSDDPSAMVYNRFVQQLNALKTQLEKSKVEVEQLIGQWTG